jgi:hypothetical protein
MINLIPQTAKRHVTKEYWLRVITVWLFIFSIVLFIITALLIPSYVTIMNQVGAYKESAEAAIADVDTFTLSSATLIKASQQARLLLSLKDQPRFTTLRERLEAAQTEEIMITRIEFTTGKDGLEPITLSGNAATRESLARFRETLLNDPTIESVFLPISNLAQDRNISFLITITMKAS